MNLSATSTSSNRVTRFAVGLGIAATAAVTMAAAIQPANAAPAQDELPDAMIWSQQYGPEMEVFVKVVNGAGGRMEQLGNDTSPSWAPGGGALTFASDRARAEMGANGREIYLADEDGSRRLTNNNSVDEHPDFSPKGDRIAYTSTDNNGGYQVSTMNLRGGLKQTLTAGSNNYDPSYSHDGEKIAFLSTRHGQRSLYEMDADGSNEREIYRSVNQLGAPSYSPDNGRVLFAEQINDDWDLYWYTIGAGIKTRITNTPAFSETSPKCSPDGLRIAYAGKLPGQRPAIHIMDYNGRNSQQVSAVGVYANWPDWLSAGPNLEAPQNQINNAGPTIQMKGRPKADRTHPAKKIKRFKGEATDPSGIQQVKISTKVKRGSNCQHLKANGKLTGWKGCAKRWVTVSEGSQTFNHQVNERLRSGSYKVVVKAKDNLDNSSKSKYNFSIR